ncbi:MAG TPA: hypothetical protein VMM37_03185 [Bacteroidota bacterium]|nr:hypothetical protein [Bacteroidota bacterium]
MRMTLLLIVMPALLAACASQSDKTVREEGQKPAMLGVQGEKIAPGRCRIVGTIISVDPTLEATGPCAKAPCRAVVRVDSILGYGSAFGTPMPVHGHVPVRFAFTLAPTTEDVFPTMTSRLPGLSVGSSFRTDIESRAEMSPEGNRSSYVIYTYERTN